MTVTKLPAGRAIGYTGEGIGLAPNPTQGSDKK